MNKTKPIIFSAPMVQAILEGRKTQTRRIVKPKRNSRCRMSLFNAIAHISGKWFGVDFNNKPFINDLIEQPKCKPGDILWVRETWSKDENGEYVYRTNYGTTEDDSFPPSMFKWRPSIFMPREAARIFLKVTNVWVERVQEITPKDAWEEGCRIGNSFPWEKHIPKLQQQCRDILFKQLWDKINSKRGYGWDVNPWVWVYEFERAEGE